MVDPKAHQLYKQVPGTTFTVGDSVGNTTATNGWVPIGLSDAVYRSYIDLSGWSTQELTTFVQGIDIQKSNIPHKAGGQFDLVFEYDFITTRRISDTELQQMTFAAYPGFLPSTLDLMQLIYGERMQYGINATVTNTFIQISGETSGSGNPTAMDKLHWTRVIVCGNAAAADSVDIYPTNLVVQAMTVEEKDLVWMERLRRSYAIQDPADI